MYPKVWTNKSVLVMVNILLMNTSPGSKPSSAATVKKLWNIEDVSIEFAKANNCLVIFSSLNMGLSIK